MELCLFDRMGALTQSVEYLPFKQRVARSNRARPTTYFEAMLSSMAFLFSVCMASVGGGGVSPGPGLFWKRHCFFPMCCLPSSPLPKNCAFVSLSPAFLRSRSSCSPVFSTKVPAMKPCGFFSKTGAFFFASAKNGATVFFMTAFFTVDSWLFTGKRQTGVEDENL